MCCPWGLQALYRGNGANVLRLVPEVGLKFALNDQFRTMFTPSDGRPIGFEGRLAAGAATGILKVCSLGASAFLTDACALRGVYSPALV